MKQFTLITVGIVISIVLSIFFDRIAGMYVHRVGYFTAFKPNITYVFDTLEFQTRSIISSQGLRNAEVGTKEPGTHRILALGDSFTHGWGSNVEDTWVRLLDNSLKAAGNRVEIINAGVPGLGIDEETRVCKAYVDRLDIDSIIITILSTDDMYQAAATEQVITLPERIVDVLWPTLSRLSDPVISFETTTPDEGNSVYLSRVWREKSAEYMKQVPRLQYRLDPRVWESFREGRMNSGILSLSLNDPRYLVRLLDEKDMAYAQTATLARLEKLKDTCARDRPVFIVMLPTQEQVSKEYFPFRVGEGFVVDDRLLTLDIDREMKPKIELLGFPYISLIAPFRSSCTEGCFYNWDLHLTPRGNAFIAAYLTQALTPLLPK